MGYGIVGAIAAWIFIGIFSGCRWLLHHVPEPVYLRTTLAGFILGILAILFPLSRYFGDEELNLLLEQNSSALTLLILAGAKMLAALNAAVTRTPISTTLLLTKLTGFTPFTPILFASLVSFFLSPKLPFIRSQAK
jgi:H+/Cl- antiporter ClcA